MRFYAFGNYYLSSLQQGLQAKHSGDELEIHYSRYRELAEQGQIETTSPLYQAWDALDDWRKNHKTVILLNGGNHQDLVDLHHFIEQGHGKFPYAIFHEDHKSLNGAATSVAIVLPAYIYETAEYDRLPRNSVESFLQPTRPTLTLWEEDLVRKLNKCTLAK